MNYDTGINLERSTSFLQAKCDQSDPLTLAFWQYRRAWAQGARQQLTNPRTMIVHCLCISSVPIATYRQWKENLAVDFNMHTIEKALESLHKDRWITVRQMGKRGKWWQVNCDLIALADHFAQSVYHTAEKQGLHPWETPIWGPWWDKDADFANLPFTEIIGSDTRLVP